MLHCGHGYGEEGTAGRGDGVVETPPLDQARLLETPASGGQARGGCAARGWLNPDAIKIDRHRNIVFSHAVVSFTFVWFRLDMTEPVIIEIDLDPAGKPPAVDSLRQLLALVDALPNGDGKFDWRLVSVSLNSPLRASLKAYDSVGDEVDGSIVEKAVEAAYDVLDATNDNDPIAATEALGLADQKKLKALLSNLKGTSGSFTVTLPTGRARTFRAQQAERVLTILAAPPKPRGEEYGSVEGEIVEVVRYYGKPALRIRNGLTGETITCVFTPEIAKEIGVEHTLDEVWGGRRVSVGGLIRFDANRRPATIEADRLRTLKSDKVSDVVSRWQDRSDGIGSEASEWHGSDA